MNILLIPVLILNTVSFMLNLCVFELNNIYLICVGNKYFVIIYLSFSYRVTMLWVIIHGRYPRQMTMVGHSWCSVGILQIMWKWHLEYLISTILATTGWPLHGWLVFSHFNKDSWILNFFLTEMFVATNSL